MLIRVEPSSSMNVVNLQVVQGGVFNGNSSNTLGCDSCNGRDVASSPCLPFNVEQYRSRLFGREFPSERPARMVGRHTQAFTVSEVVKAVEKFERVDRPKSKWFGGIDCHHVFFEGLCPNAEKNAFCIRWGS